MPYTPIPVGPTKQRNWDDFDPVTGTFLDLDTGQRVNPDGTPYMPIPVQAPSFESGRYPGTTGEPLPYSTTPPAGSGVSLAQRALGRALPAAESILGAAGTAEEALGESGVGRAFRAVSEPFAGAITQGLRPQVGPIGASPQRPYPERALTFQETYEQEPLPFVTGLAQEAINPLTYFPGAKLPSVRKAVAAATKVGGEAAARAGVAGGEAVGRAMRVERPGARTVAAGRARTPIP